MVNLAYDAPVDEPPRKQIEDAERRLYELAMFNCTPEFEYTVPIEELAKRVGSTREIRKFKAELKDIAERDALPQYRLELALDLER